MSIENVDVPANPTIEDLDTLSDLNFLLAAVVVYIIKQINLDENLPEDEMVFFPIGEVRDKYRIEVSKIQDAVTGKLVAGIQLIKNPEIVH